MIIKSMPRKEATFSQLYDYIKNGQSKGDEKYNYHHNFYDYSREGVIFDFEENARRLDKRKNGNFLYHEVISLKSSSKLSREKQKEIFSRIVNNYIEERAGNCLVFGGIHDEEDHNLHYHLIISANELNQNKRNRLSKAEFSSIKNNFENYVLECHPELEQEAVMGKKKDGLKEKVSEAELKKRTGEKTKKEQVFDRVSEAFDSVKNEKEFDRVLESFGLSYYKRGKSDGVLDLSTGKKYRLKTLGLNEKYNETKQRLITASEGDDKSEEVKQDYTPYQDDVRVKNKVKDQVKQEEVKNQTKGNKHSKASEDLKEFRSSKDNKKGHSKGKWPGALRVFYAQKVQSILWRSVTKKHALDLTAYRRKANYQDGRFRR